MMVKKLYVIIENVVKGMFFKNKLGRVMIKKFFVYVGDEYFYYV